MLQKNLNYPLIYLFELNHKNYLDWKTFWNYLVIRNFGMESSNIPNWSVWTHFNELRRSCFKHRETWFIYLIFLFYYSCFCLFMFLFPQCNKNNNLWESWANLKVFPMNLYWSKFLKYFFLSTSKENYVLFLSKSARTFLKMPSKFRKGGAISNICCHLFWQEFRQTIQFFGQSKLIAANC